MPKHAQNKGLTTRRQAGAAAVTAAGSISGVELSSSLPYLADQLGDRPCELPTHSQLPTCPLVGLLLLALTTAAAGAPRAASVLQPRTRYTILKGSTSIVQGIGYLALSKTTMPEQPDESPEPPAAAMLQVHRLHHGS